MRYVASTGLYEETTPSDRQVAWTSSTNLTGSSPNTLEKTGGTTWWDAGAISTQSITSGDANGYVSVVADATNKHRMFGLGNANVNASYDDIEYGLHLMDNGTLEILESGANRGNVGAYSIGDVLKVSVEGGYVKYYRNSTLLYTSSVSPSYPLYLDTSFYTMNSKLTGSKLCAGSGCLDGTTSRYYYTFNGQVVAQRYVDEKDDTLSYLSGDHLGSVSLVTNSSGASAGVQKFDPWGKVRASFGGGVTQTKLNYTGQKLDDTGLLYYHARMYEPGWGRFVSPDSIVPGASSGVGGAGGTVGREQNSKLTVDFHESNFVSSVAGENAQILQKGFWFQLTSRDQRNIDPSGPNNPQSLSRYSYVLNNPIRYVDPTGHTSFGVQDALDLRTLLRDIIAAAKDAKSPGDFLSGLASTASGSVLGVIIGGVVTGAKSGAMVGGVAGALAGALVGGVVASILNGNAEAFLNALSWLENQLSYFLERVSPDDKTAWFALYLGTECYCIAVNSSLGRYYHNETKQKVPTDLYYQLFDGSLIGYRVSLGGGGGRGSYTE